MVEERAEEDARAVFTAADNPPAATVNVIHGPLDSFYARLMQKARVQVRRCNQGLAKEASSSTVTTLSVVT
jgi:hypothetical protein